MRKIKIPKFKTKKINFNNLLNYIISVVLSSLILALILISLPLTERISSSSTYDLVNKSTLYWSKEYILEFNSEESIVSENDIENTKSILQKRLRKYSVEKSSVYSFTQDSKYYIRITVQTSKSEEMVDSLLTSPFIIRVVTRKADVNFEDSENPLALYLAENYDDTEFTRDTFRNVYITKLKNSANEYSYFALFKTWPWESEWEDFLTEYAGQDVGLAIDDFVTPVQVPADQSLFAVGVSSTEKEYANITSILYNSGNIPLSYTVIDQVDIPTDNPEIDYIKLTEGILIATILIYVYLLLIEGTPKNTLVKSGLATIISITAWIAYLKISETPIDIFILAVEIISIIALIRIITENTESSIIVTVLVSLISSICIVLGTGYVKILASDLLLLMILCNISIPLTTYYIFNVRKSLRL